MADLPVARFDRRNVDQRTGLDVSRQAHGEQARKETTEALGRGLMPVNSSWVQAMKWVPGKDDRDDGMLFVLFRPKGNGSGALVRYDHISEAFYDEFYAAGSKGRFVHLYLYDRPYTLV